MSNSIITSLGIENQNQLQLDVQRYNSQYLPNCG